MLNLAGDDQWSRAKCSGKEPSKRMYSGMAGVPILCAHGCLRPVSVCVNRVTNYVCTHKNLACSRISVCAVMYLCAKHEVYVRFVRMCVGGMGRFGVGIVAVRGHRKRAVGVRTLRPAEDSLRPVCTLICEIRVIVVTYA